MQDSILGLNFNPAAVNRHELYQNNIASLDDTIKALEDGNIKEAYDDYLWAVDWAWYHMYFDEETCDYMENQLFENREGTWGSGLIAYPHSDIRGVVDSLKIKYDEEGADVSAEIEELKALRDVQQQYLEETYAAEKSGLQTAIDLMEQYAK